MALLRIFAESHNSHSYKSCESVCGVTYTGYEGFYVFVNLAKSRDRPSSGVTQHMPRIISVTR